VPKVDISLKKQAKQVRSIATVNVIIETATNILKHDGAARFTTNKVAERAGVAVASLYQYFPNKEALLFQVARVTWEREIARLLPILIDDSADHGTRLRRLIREFFLVEATEASLRRALRRASIDMRDTSEYQALMVQGAEQSAAFFREAFSRIAGEDLGFHVDFVGLVITSVAERATDDQVCETDILRKADLLADMILCHYRI
jgi:AcrR family transcriptional regulator